MHFKYSVLAPLLLSALSAQASEFIATNQYLVTKDQTVTAEQWVSAGTIQADGIFGNDLFLASESKLLLSGTYAGNLWGAAGTEVLFAGTCERNARLAGQTIRINGPVSGNLMAMANSISIGTNATISGNARLIGNQIIVEGAINGTLSLSAMRTATISGSVLGDARITAPDIILQHDARIHGDLVYTTGKELIPATDVVAGKLSRMLPERPYAGARLRRHALWFLAALLTGVPFISLFPMTTAMASLLVRKSPMKCLLVGFVATGALPFFGLISLSTIIGFPLGAVILASWGILIYVSRIIMGLMIGTLVLKTGSTSAGRVLMAMATGLAIIYFITFIPSAIGGIVQVIVIWMGMGSLLLALVQKRRLIIQIPEELKQLEALKNEQNKSTEVSP